MPLRLLMDVHVRSQVTDGLRERGIDVLTAQEDGADLLPDNLLLDRAGELGRVLISQDKDLLVETARRLRNGIPFPGIIFARQTRISDRQAIQDLELICGVYEPAEFRDRVEYIPLK